MTSSKTQVLNIQQPLAVPVHIPLNRIWLRTTRAYRFWIRLTHWEYWPSSIVYGPIYFYWLWLSIKARSFYFFNTANPSIVNGGFVMDGKYDIYKLMPAGTYPPTILVKHHDTLKSLAEKMQTNGIEFPLIAKPDIGMQGLGVSKLHNPAQLSAYLENAKVDILIQPYIDYTEEAGIFYCRLPYEQKGKITGIVGKAFVVLTGNGQSTVEELLLQNSRYALQWPALKVHQKSLLQSVLPVGEILNLVPYGNHRRGSKFVDVTSFADEALTETLNNICTQISGFYYGRLDIRFANWESLKLGHSFSIIEVNGAGSEPTHIFDPAHSIWFAWQEIIKHWKILYRISNTNQQKYNLRYLTLKEGLLLFKANREHIRKLKG